MCGRVSAWLCVLLTECVVDCCCGFAVCVWLCVVVRVGVCGCVIVWLSVCVRVWLGGCVCSVAC